jgi:hypothetical protein
MPLRKKIEFGVQLLVFLKLFRSASKTLEAGVGGNYPQPPPVSEYPFVFPRSSNQIDHFHQISYS